MLQHLKPTDAALERMALAETDVSQQARFAPIRWGFAGNLAVILFAGGAGLIHAGFATLWRKVFGSTP